MVVFRYIEESCNLLWRHLPSGYLSPVEYERMFQQMTETVVGKE